MTTPILPPDIRAQIRALQQRLRSLETDRSLPGGMSRTPGGQIIFPGAVGIGGVIVGAPPTALLPSATNLAITPGQDLGDFFLDIGWSPATGPGADQIIGYEVRWYPASGTGSYQMVSTNSARISRLRAGTAYTVEIRSVTRLGQYAAALVGTGTTLNDTTAPAAPTGVTVTGAFRMLVVRWTENTDWDVTNGAGLYQVQVDLSTGTFASPVRDVRASGTSIAVGDLAANTTYKARVRAIDSSGNVSAWSTEVTATTLRIVTGDVGFTLGGFNMLGNSSFEALPPASTIPPAWATYNSTGSTRSSEVVARHGSFTAKILSSIATVNDVGLMQSDASGGWTAIPANTPVMVSAWVYPGPGVTQARLMVRDDPANNTWGVSSQFTVTPETWQRISVPFLSSTLNLTRVYVTFRKATAWAVGELAGHIESVQLETGDVLTAYTPRAGEVVAGQITGPMISPTALGAGSNMVLNSSFEVDTDNDGLPNNWLSSVTSGVTITRSRPTATADKRHGAFGFKQITTNHTSGSHLAGFYNVIDQIRGGLPYTFSFDYRVDEATLTRIRIDIQFYDGPGGTGTNVGTNLIPFVNPPFTIGQWTRFVLANQVAPAAAVSARIYIRACGEGGASTTTPGSMTLLLDSVQVEQGEAVSAYAPRVEEILPGTVTSAELADNAVTSVKLIDAAVAEAKLAANAVTSGKIAASAVVADKIAADAVTATKILAGSVTTAKLAAAAVTANEIATDAVIAVKIAAGAITTAKIAAGAVTANEIAANTITAAKIAAGTITATEIATDAITAAKIVAGAISTDKLAADSVTTAKLAAGAVTAAKITAGTITATELAAAAVTADKLAANSVTAAKVASLTMEVGKFIRSSNYVAGSTGWNVDADGSAEFNNVTIRGSLIAGPVNITPSAGLLLTTAAEISIPESTTQAIRWYGSLADQANTFAASLRTMIHSDGYEQMTVNFARTNARFIVVGKIYGRQNLTVGGTYTESGDAIETAGTGSGICIRQRDLAVTDSTNRVIVYATGGFGYLWQGVNVLQWRGSAGASEVWFPSGLPALAGNTVTYNTTSKQMGYATSAARFKANIRTPGWAGAANPIFKIPARAFDWTKEVQDRSDPQARLAQAGFIADEINQIAPNAVWLDAEGRPHGLNLEALLAYLVDAVQYVARGGRITPA